MVDAICPLTLFDTAHGATVIALGWLVEGYANPEKLSIALDNVIAKWPMLGGRLEKTKDRYQIRIPLRGYAEGYRPYILTSATSERPLSSYIPLPIPMATDVIPYHLMGHPDTPKTRTEWIIKGYPPLCWHITHFVEGEELYSVIGLTFPHAILDGLGVATVVHAVEAELLGKSWPIPDKLLEGENANILDAELDKMGRRRKEEGENYSRIAYNGVDVVGAWLVFVFFVWSWWQVKWHKSRGRMLVVPAKAVVKLINDTRKILSDEGRGHIKVSKGDILAAFICKAVFSDGSSPSTRIHPTSMASLRRFFNGKLDMYPHNCFAPLDYPDSTIEEFTKSSLASLAGMLAGPRPNLTGDSALQFREISLKASRTGKFVVPHKAGMETIAITNVCIANIVNIDWTGTGAGRTMTRHKIGFLPLGVSFTNSITIAGFLDDGSLLLNVRFMLRRLNRLEEAVAKLIEDAADSNIMKEAQGNATLLWP